MSLDDYINEELPPNTHKFEHRILITGSKDSTKIITGIPLIDNETKELVAFVEIMREKNKYQL